MTGCATEGKSVHDIRPIPNMQPSRGIFDSQQSAGTQLRNYFITLRAESFDGCVVERLA